MFHFYKHKSFRDQDNLSCSSGTSVKLSQQDESNKLLLFPETLSHNSAASEFIHLMTEFKSQITGLIVEWITISVLHHICCFYVPVSFSLPIHSSIP